MNVLDLTYQGIDPANGLHHVTESLYPESRGFKVYHFATKEEALEFERTGQ
jgi:hypothetical protein